MKRTIAYRKEEIPQTSPSMSGPVIPKRVEDMPAEWQVWLQSLKPPTTSEGREYKQSIGGFRKVR